MNKWLWLAVRTDAKILWVVLFVAPGFVVQAQQDNFVERSRCSTADIDAYADCRQANPLYGQHQQELSTDDATQSSGQLRGYVGGSLGAFFPDDEFADTSFGGSIFFGAEFNKNLGLEFETVFLGGGTELRSVDYSAWALFINPRFNLPLDADSQDAKINLYLSPGLGLSQSEIDFASDDFELEFEDETLFTVQVKLGIEFDISRTNSLFFQGRYVTQAAESSDAFRIFSGEFFSVEAGTKVSF